jgi:endonuclease-3
MKAAKSPIKKPEKVAAKKAIKPKKPRRDPLAPERVAAILQRLAEAYPNVKCALHHRNAW